VIEALNLTDGFVRRSVAKYPANVGCFLKGPMSEVLERVSPPEVPAETAKASRDSERVVVVEPSRGWSALHLREVWNYRDLMVALAERDLRVRYKQTALGVAWVILQPLAAAGIMTLVFGKIAGMKVESGSYFAFSFAGMLGWNVFGNTLTRVSTCLVGNSALISKIFFPRLILPLSAMGGIVVDLAVAGAMMAVLMVIYGIAPGWGLVTFPLWLAMLMMASLGVGMWAAALTVSYRDVQYLIPFATQFLVYASPVGYSIAKSPDNVKLLMYCNPVTGALEGLRWSLLGTTQLPPAGAIAWSAASSVGLFILGAVIFKRMERKFADVI